MRTRAISLLLPGLLVLVFFLGMTGSARADSVNVLTNGTFDSDLSGWTTVATTGVTWDSSTQTAHIGRPGPIGDATFSQGFNFSGTELSISFDYEWQVNKPFTEDFFTAELLYENTGGIWTTVQLLNEGSNSGAFGTTVSYYGQVSLTDPNGNAKIQFTLNENGPLGGGAGTRVQLDNVYVGGSSTVPEPATLSLLGIGLLVVGVFRKRFR